MRLLILHLSDFHFRSKSDSILSRVSLICDAVKNIDYHLDMAVVVATGDISFSGSEDQLLLGFDFLTNLAASLSKALIGSDNNKEVKVYLAIVPGNHDCFVSKEDRARDIVVNSILSDKSAATDPSVIKMCSQVQDKFFECRDAFVKQGLKHFGHEGRLFYQYIFEHGSESICFNCFNTAWMSRMDEQQGAIVFPIDQFHLKRSSETAVVSIFITLMLGWKRTMHVNIGRQLRKCQT